MTDRLTASVCKVSGSFGLGYVMLALFAALVR